MSAPNQTKEETSTTTLKRPSRACTARGYRAKRESPSPSPPPPLPRQHQCNIVTPLVAEPTLSQLPRWHLRSTCQLPSVLSFFNVFRPLLKINVEFSAEELETALITPNNILRDIQIPLLKAIPPNTRSAIGHNTWITVLCRKLRDWWYWVAEGELPIVAAHGAEIEAYNALDPVVRVLILKALCDIRVEQEDIRNYIDNTIKSGVHLSTFRKERVGGDSFGISYWYEDDPVIGHRLYRETRKVEMGKATGKNVPPIPTSSYQWETVATNLDEFQDVSEKLFLSKNRTEVSLGKKLKTEMLPEIEKVHKNKEDLVLAQRKNIEKLLKKQHRESLLLGSTINMNGLGPGRSRRDRKHVTYTFDDYEQSINKAIKTTKQNQLLPEATSRKEISAKPGASISIRWTRSLQAPPQASLDAPSPKSFVYDHISMDHKPDVCSNLQRQEPPPYSDNGVVEAASDHEESNVVGEVLHDNQYWSEKKQKRKLSGCSEGEKRHHLVEEHHKCAAAAGKDGTVDSSSMNVDIDERRRFKKLYEDNMENSLRSVDELQLHQRNGDKPTRIRITFKQHKISDPETQSTKLEKVNSRMNEKILDNAKLSVES